MDDAVAGPSKRTAQELLKELEEAREAYTEADRSHSLAERRRTEALNTCNRLQKEFDEAVEEVRKQAPRETDWGRTNADYQRRAQ